MAKMTPELARATLLKLCKAALNKKFTDPSKESYSILSQFQKKRASYNMLASDLVRKAIYEILLEEGRSRRSQIWNPPNLSHNQNRQRLVNATNRTLMHFIVPIVNKPLGDCTKTDLAVGKEFYHQQGRDMVTKYWWLDDVEQNLPSNTLVNRHYQVQQLEVMKDNAEARANKHIP